MATSTLTTPRVRGNPLEHQTTRRAALTGAAGLAAASAAAVMAPVAALAAAGGALTPIGAMYRAAAALEVRIVALDAEIEALCDAHPVGAPGSLQRAYWVASEHDALLAQSSALCAEQDELHDALVKAPAQSIRDVALKVRVLQERTFLEDVGLHDLDPVLLQIAEELEALAGPPRR